MHLHEFAIFKFSRYSFSLIHLHQEPFSIIYFSVQPPTWLRAYEKHICQEGSFSKLSKNAKSFTSVFNIFIKYKKCQTVGDAYLTCLAPTWPWTSPMASRPAKLRVDPNDHLPMILTAQLGAQV
jgi:hypothetical protein